MGSIQKLKNGRYRARYRVAGSERSRVFGLKKDAQSWLTTQTADVARGAWIDPSLGRMHFETWAARWEDGIHSWRPTTEALNLGVVRNHLLPRFAGWPIANITPSEVKGMIADGIAEGASTSAVRRRVIVLRSMLDAAVEEGRLGRNPCAAVGLPPERTRKMRTLDAAQVHELTEAFPDHYQPLVYTAAFVGLRWGELAGLRVRNLDLLRRTILVEEQLVDMAGGVHFGPPKTRSGTRRVSVPAAICDLLSVHIASGPVRESGLVFCTVTGRAMRRSNFYKPWRSHVESVFGGTELETLTFHELRHTAASLAIAEGAHPLTVKERLGHSSITVTMDRYGHMFPAQDQALSDALDTTFRTTRTAGARGNAKVVPMTRR